jgi:nitroreductase
MNVYDAILTKRAIRKFTDEPLPDDVIYKILNAGRRSQSSKNTQPWNFVAVRDRALMQQIAATRQNLHHVTEAALCVAFVTENKEETSDFSSVAFDLGQAAAYMQLAAQGFGVGSALGTVHEKAAVHQMLGLPDNMGCTMLISFGFPAPEEQRPLKPHGRRPLDEVVHWDKW